MLKKEHNQKCRTGTEERPKIKLELTTADKTIELIGWLSIIAIWGLTITNYADLPGTIPTHYNEAGQADRFGGKITILILPLIATILFIGMTILNKFPQIFNYPANITKRQRIKAIYKCNKND